MPAKARILSAFSFGTNQFMMAREMSNQVLRCLVDPTDLSGLVYHVTISAGSIRFLIGNARMGVGARACGASCFANNPTPDLQEGLGELRDQGRADPLRRLRDQRPSGGRELRRAELARSKNLGQHAHHDQPRDLDRG